MGPEGGKPMTWADVTLREFQDALACSAPTPGGGSAAGVSLGQAAALAVMVSDLTLGNETLREGWAISEQVKAIAIPMLEEGLNLARKTVKPSIRSLTRSSYPKILTNSNLNEEEAIRSATLGAAEVPYRTAVSALHLLKLLPELARKAIPMQHLT